MAEDARRLHGPLLDPQDKTRKECKSIEGMVFVLA